MTTAGSEPDRLTPLRPLEFFSQPWVGEGEFVPFLLGRRFARQFEFRSECEFISDSEWIVRDTTRIDDDRVETRRMRARLVAPDLVETSADDMPGGTEVSLLERGFTFRPYRLEVPVGRLRGRVRCRDRCWLDQEDVLHDEIRMSWFGLPVGKVAMRLRRKQPEP